MGFGGVRPWRGPAGAALVCALVGSAGAAQAALSDRLCSPFATAALPAYPTGEALRSAARSAETRLARRDATDAFQDLAPALDLPTSGSEAPSPAAVAEYCIAAGELMRLSPQGSQYQAQSY